MITKTSKDKKLKFNGEGLGFAELMYLQLHHSFYGFIVTILIDHNLGKLALWICRKIV